jgi:hypothetical protein
MPNPCMNPSEESIIEKFDDAGTRWVKKYVGGGLHFANWLQQFKEVYGYDNVEVEEADTSGLTCYGLGKEKLFRIWVKEK